MYLGTINNYFLWDEVEIPSTDKQATVPNCMTLLNKGFPANIRKKSYAFQEQAAGKREEINTERAVDHPWSVLFFSSTIEGIKFYFINFSPALPKLRVLAPGLV